MSEFERVEDYLPETVKEIVGVIGLPATEKLIKAFGGFSFQFSNGKLYFNKLKEVLGQDDAVKLQAYMGACEVYLPRCDSALRMLRNQQIYADFRQFTEQEGLSGRLAIMQICPKYGVCDRVAWEAVRYYQRKHTVSQATLF